MKLFTALALLALTTTSAFAAIDCHLANEGTQDSLVTTFSCNTAAADYDTASGVCQALCEAKGCDTFFVNTYRPSARLCR